MKRSSFATERGSVLITAFLTITILTMICATSLYVTSQNQNSGTQTASWQQALSGAEAAVDQALRALNASAAGTSGAWSNWQTVTSGTLPTTKPSGGSPTGGAPTSGYYNYSVPAAITLNGEGNNSVTSWVTIDTGGSGLMIDHNGNQWYRIRATGVAGAPGPARVSNTRLDNDLRKIGLRFDRKTGGTINTPQATRTIEVIAAAKGANLFAHGVLMRNSISMSGSAYIDSFDSANPFKSTNGLYDATKRQTNGDIATIDSGSNSNLQNMQVYGSLTYSGSPIKNTGGVTGTISTPFNATISNTSNPTWAAGSYSTMGSIQNTTTINAGTKNSPALIKVSGDVNLSGSNILTIAATNSGNDNNYAILWVTGQLALSAQAKIVQQTGVNLTIYVDSQIQVSGGGVANGNNVASMLTIIGVGNNQNAQLSAQSNFIGVINAPGYNFQLSGSGIYSGAFIGNTLQMSAQSAIHYDEALRNSGGSSAITYSFASWFEDNSDPTHKDVNGNYIIY